MAKRNGPRSWSTVDVVKEMAAIDAERAECGRLLAAVERANSRLDAEGHGMSILTQSDEAGLYLAHVVAFDPLYDAHPMRLTTRVGTCWGDAIERAMAWCGVEGWMV